MRSLRPPDFAYYRADFDEIWYVGPLIPALVAVICTDVIDPTAHAQFDDSFSLELLGPICVEILYGSVLPTILAVFSDLSHTSKIFAA